jgi:hypothetical protein
MKLTVALLAVVAAVVTGSAAAGPPSPTVTCVAGGTTSFAHPPKGTDSVLFMYSPTVFFTWTGKAKRDTTPDAVHAGDSVTAGFYNGQDLIDSITVTCS